MCVAKKSYKLINLSCKFEGMRMCCVNSNSVKGLKIIIITVVLYGSNILAQKMSMGFCPPIEPMEYFDIHRVRMKFKVIKISIIKRIANN